MQKTASNLPSGSRVVLYMRVSTGRQALNDLSIPDQRKQLEAYCKEHSHQIVAEFIDAKSGRNDNRDGFQKMMAFVSDQHAKIDLILVHSFSRFFRDGVESEVYIRGLKKKNIQVVSLTQKTEDTPHGNLVRRILAIVDEVHSEETAKHVKRSLRENALQGFWNGGNTPYGYRVVEAEKRGRTSKKKLAVHDEHAALLQKMFYLSLHGDDNSGPMGIKRVVNWLNERGYKTRAGNKWSIAVVQ
ncbi:hypothetical protein GCM10011402_38470 [Paracoccus acridae]|uniref:Resolvase/invertase-type recombinase catalytic domain-containing protein n=1 Tax=Paracoccus acridae TaxID=1795310 RepID=A0ABQ1VNU0_9RHOB|nr:recombinase family protein [Paracoccus acridae]GGF82180.1 hypothetical protein GCM10011402_38470 [Paracoccus acridae]